MSMPLRWDLKEFHIAPFLSIDIHCRQDTAQWNESGLRKNAYLSIRRFATSKYRPADWFRWSLEVRWSWHWRDLWVFCRISSLKTSENEDAIFACHRNGMYSLSTQVMLFKSSVSLLIYSSVLFILHRSVYSQDDPLQRSKRAAANGDPLCTKQDKPIDAAYPPRNITANTRKKRFVVFPEFVNYMDDWRYLQQADEIRYWIANFYPKRISQEALHDSIIHIFEQVKFALDKDIPILNATDPKNANFQIDLFDYTKCPTDDTPDATVADVQVYQSLYIYPAKLTQESRYRAHGGINLYDKDKPMSVVKLNMQQTFLVSTDYVYDPIIYTCLEPENVCQIDLYYVLLHEILHGFGIEVTISSTSIETSVLVCSIRPTQNNLFPRSNACNRWCTFPLFVWCVTMTFERFGSSITWRWIETTPSTITPVGEIFRWMPYKSWCTKLAKSFCSFC